MYVCMYVYTYTYIHTYIHTYILRTHTHTHTQKASCQCFLSDGFMACCSICAWHSRRRLPSSSSSLSFSPAHTTTGRVRSVSICTFVPVKQVN